MTDIKKKCTEYLASRISDYEFRCIRFKAVADKMVEIGLRRGCTVVDVGAGRMDFCRYLRSIGWVGEYIPIDGAIDGTDLNLWVPPEKHHFLVAIEVVEHVYDPFRLMREMAANCTLGAVCTTPNSEKVDVLGCDPDHVSIVTIDDWVKARLERRSSLLIPAA